MNIKKQNNINVELFFESYANSFDSIYGHNKKRNFIGRTNDKLFRKEMYIRFQQTLKNINNDNIFSILDIGCGSGRYCAEYLRYGKSVIGIDLAQRMLAIANRICGNNFPNGDFKFIHADYFDYAFDKKFDASVLMGLFDYIENSKSLLEKLSRDTNKIILASFPKRWNILTLQRMIRYKIRQCPLFFYTKKQIENMLNDLGMNNYELTDNGREFYLKIMSSH